MKVKKIGALCKAMGVCLLYDELGEQGEIRRQWISNGNALWPVSGLPMLEKSNLSTLFDFNENQLKNMVLDERELPGWLYDLAHDDIGEAPLAESPIRIKADGREPLALYDGPKVIWLNAAYLGPCWTKETRLVARDMEDGRAVAVMDGLFLCGIILPAATSPDFFREIIRLGVSGPRTTPEPEDGDADGL